MAWNIYNHFLNRSKLLLNSTESIQISTEQSETEFTLFIPVDQGHTDKSVLTHSYVLKIHELELNFHKSSGGSYSRMNDEIHFVVT